MRKEERVLLKVSKLRMSCFSLAEPASFWVGPTTTMVSSRPVKAVHKSSFHFGLQFDLWSRSVNRWMFNLKVRFLQFVSSLVSCERTSQPACRLRNANSSKRKIKLKARIEFRKQRVKSHKSRKLVLSHLSQMLEETVRLRLKRSESSRWARELFSFSYLFDWTLTSEIESLPILLCFSFAAAAAAAHLFDLIELLAQLVQHIRLTLDKIFDWKYSSTAELNAKVLRKKEKKWATKTINHVAQKWRHFLPVYSTLYVQRRRCNGFQVSLFARRRQRRQQLNQRLTCSSGVNYSCFMIYSGIHNAW